MSNVMNPLARECAIHERTKKKLKEALEEIERLKIIIKGEKNE